MQRRLLSLAAHFNHTYPKETHLQFGNLKAVAMSTAVNPSFGGVSLSELPKSHVFTSNLPPDAEYPDPAAAEQKPRPGPRMVRNAAFTFVKPEPGHAYKLLAVSPAAFESLGLKSGEEKTDEFQELVSGNKFYSEHYPWAQCYGGYQFGSWAGQLGDGRAISLFESTNPNTNVRYEIQLKGAGMTPYSRFADGKAVLRSSIREFIVSEALNALHIPTTRALSLSLLPDTKARRESIETCAIVCRFAQSWIRFGTFDLPRSRGDRVTTRKLADYVIEHVYGGVQNLTKPREDEPDGTPNRYELLYREIIKRNAKTVALWQAYGFMNGVLNTDNTSILGLSLDFGPFAFMDNFDPNYTPNHDDHSLRYSYGNQPTIIWWNLVRLGEALAELFGAGDDVDDAVFIEKGVSKERADVLITRAEGIIDRGGEEYKQIFIGHYKEVMTKRLGFQTMKDTDMEEQFSTCLDMMQEIGIDFSHFFRRLSVLPISQMESEESRIQAAKLFLNPSSTLSMVGGEEKAKKMVADWLLNWRKRLYAEENVQSDEERQKAMKAVNPKFVPKAWVLDEVIQRVQRDQDTKVLEKVLKMALNPFDEHWGPESEWKEEERFCGDVPASTMGLQCSCSS